MSETCADCGVTIVQNPVRFGYKDQWGHETRPGVWSMCCRIVDGEEPGRIESADYHYVKGETQRHFQAVHDE